MKDFLNRWYPIIIAFGCMCYSIGLGVTGHTEEAQYSAHWAGTYYYSQSQLDKEDEYSNVYSRRFYI